MTATISDLTGYLSPYFALYPALPSGFKEQIARSLTALQDAYFEELNAMTDQTETTVSDSGRILLSTLEVERGIAPDEGRVTAVYLEGKRLKRVSPEDFPEQQSPCFCFLDGALQILPSAVAGNEKVKIYYKFLPAAVTVSESGVFSGEIYLAPKHLPLLVYKLQEELCRVSGEETQAELYAKAYGDFADRLAQGFFLSPLRRKL